MTKENGCATAASNREMQPSGGPRRGKGEAMVSPCKTCTNTEAPTVCDSKKCKQWEEWFLSEWKKFNNYYERCMKAQVKEDG